MRIIILFFIISVSLLSCKQISEDTKEHIEEKETKGLVELNNGKLWKANPETTLGINKMISRMQYFSEKENLLTYKSLKDSLESDFTEIFQKCTMKGEAHNQLHNYLKPMIDQFDGLDSQELEICKNNFTNLNMHLKNYRNYFE
jgi:hypothetical protein